ncbi:MAG: hypothetical protein V1932_02215 [Chloroflexota bacterium]
MKKTKYTQPKVEKVDRIAFPCEDQGKDIEAEYTCSGTGWNSGTGRGCLDVFGK